MPSESISGRLYCLLGLGFLYLKHKFFSRISGRPTQGRDDSDGFTSAGSHTAHTSNVLDEPHLSLRPTPPLTSPIDGHLRVQPPQTRSRKRKALLIGIEYNNEPPTRTERGPRPLKGPHKDVLDMRRFLIGGFKFKLVVRKLNYHFTGRLLAI